jgi:hypothetical protein
MKAIVAHDALLNVIGTMAATADHRTCSIDARHNAEKHAIWRRRGRQEHVRQEKAPQDLQGFFFRPVCRSYFPAGVVLGLALPLLELVPLGVVAPVDDFILAPVVVDECVVVDAWGLLCLYIFADAANGEPASPAITSAAIVSLLFTMTWNSSLDHTGGNCCQRVQFRRHCECLIVSSAHEERCTSHA